MTSPVPDRLTVLPAGPLRGEVAAPGSKSVTNRLLLQAALADGVSVLRTPLRSDDSAAMRAVVTGLGADVIDLGSPGGVDHAWRVTGRGGADVPTARTLDCRLSGTAMRFGTAVAALSATDVTLTGGAPLLRRPLGPLAAALRTLGARVDDADGFPPVTVGGGLRGGEVDVDVTGSSQYASAVLLAAPYATEDVVLTAAGVHAGAYVALTVAGMRAWGATVVDRAPGIWHVVAGNHYRPQDVVVEYDASAACHLWALAVATGGEVTVTNVTPTVQPDAALLDVLAAMGATVTRRGRRVTVVGPSRPQPLGTVDLEDMPDQATTVAALAALADGVTTITGAAVVRGHETDRLAALAIELRKVGARVDEHPDGLTIDGSRATGGGDGAVLGTHHDHRLAMAFASVGARLPGVVIDDPGCVAKTFPDFWDVLAALGGRLG